MKNKNSFDTNEKIEQFPIIDWIDGVGNIMSEKNKSDEAKLLDKIVAKLNEVIDQVNLLGERK